VSTTPAKPDISPPLCCFMACSVIAISGVPANLKGLGHLSRERVTMFGFPSLEAMVCHRQTKIIMAIEQKTFGGMICPPSMILLLSRLGYVQSGWVTAGVGC